MSMPIGSIPVLPLKNTVLYPGITQTLRVGRDKSLKAVDAAQLKDNWIITLAQRYPEKSIESTDDLFHWGTLAKIESVKGNHEQGYFVTLRGYHRMKVTTFKKDKEIYEAYTERLDDKLDVDPSTESALHNSLKQISIEVLRLVPGNTEHAQELVLAIEDVGLLTYLAAANIEIPMEERQHLLEMTSIKDRTMHMLNLMNQQKENLQIRHDIRQKMTSKLGQNQREHILREQLKTIKEELGEGTETSQVDDYRQKIKSANMPSEAQDLAIQQVKKLENMNQQAPEYQMIRSHLDLMVSLPWDKTSVKNAFENSFNLDDAEKVLNEDHYGLDKIKKRILQHLAVIKMKKDKRGSILLFIGPPGVGKTSLGQSIARALGKKYQRISLGGVRDESEIRGHRRTYIGAMPGRIISALKKSGENDSLFLLDEIDKMSRSFSGDPASAMLEVLDPEQNTTFTDHYLDTAFDLSNIFFIATANSLEGIPLPLLDRMEVIDLSGYTIAEKFHIAKTHLIPKQIKEHGLTVEQLQVSDEVLFKTISHYTREAGVRELQRKIAEMARYASEKLLRGETAVTIDLAKLEEILGPERYISEVADVLASPGVVTGLAWTPVGGDILFIETALVPGKGDLIITGQLGDVMKESAQIAKSLVKARLQTLAPTFDFSKFDIHLHVPSGGIPKDGPSAGITLLTSMASLISRRTVNPKLAMTGEISLRGKVLPVGGIKEKIIAAHRAGITEIIMSERNEKDLRDVPEEVRSQLKIHTVQHINEVLTISLGIDLSDWTDEMVFHPKEDQSVLQDKLIT